MAINSTNTTSTSLVQGLEKAILRAPRTFPNFLQWPIPLLRFIYRWPFVPAQTKDGNKLFSIFIWGSFVLTSNSVEVETRGTWAARLGAFLWPAFLLLILDLLAFPVVHRLKSRGKVALPLQQLKPLAILGIFVVALLNVLLGVGVQYGLAAVLKRVLHLPPVFAISFSIPPWRTIGIDLAKTIPVRAVVHYAIHRWVMHEWNSPLKRWHLSWQHSVRQPFSLVAAYDHPINYLLLHWVPVYLPAVIARIDICSWYYLLIWVGLEDLFLYSGYSIVPVKTSWLMVSRRTDAHFQSLNGNYGRWGIIDYFMGTLLSESKPTTTTTTTTTTPSKLTSKSSKSEQQPKTIKQTAQTSTSGSNKGSAKKRKNAH